MIFLNAEISVLQNKKQEEKLLEKVKVLFVQCEKKLNLVCGFTETDVLGSLQNEECRIDSIAQSWATISGAGDNDKKYISRTSLLNNFEIIKESYKKISEA